MNDKEKAREISYHYLQQVGCYKKTIYDEDDILSTARDAAMEMAAWKDDYYKKLLDLLVESGADANIITNYIKNCIES